MSGPSRHVREAMERRAKEGRCPVCGAELVDQLLKPLARKVCPNGGDWRHRQAGVKVRLK